MSSCARSSAAARRRCGFADLAQLRLERGLTIAAFCQIVGLPARTYYDRRARNRARQTTVRGPWPTPARDRVGEKVLEMALTFPMWGHRKIAWLCRHDGHDVSGCDLPAGTARRRAGAAGRLRPRATRPREGPPRGVRHDPHARNRVWQTDFFELETRRRRHLRSGDVIDYATKLVLAGPVTATQTTRDAIAASEDAPTAVHDLLGRPLIDDISCPATGAITPVIVVSDNGPCYESTGFACSIDSRPELTHVRTRRKSPQTGGVIERYHGSIQIEDLWHDLPAD